MTKRKALSESERASELAKMDLLPDAVARKRADALVKKMLDTPPDPFTPKKKRAKRAK